MKRSKLCSTAWAITPADNLHINKYKCWKRDKRCSKIKADRLAAAEVDEKEKVEKELGNLGLRRKLSENKEDKCEIWALFLLRCIVSLQRQSPLQNLAVKLIYSNKNKSKKGNDDLYNFICFLRRECCRYHVTSLPFLRECFIWTYEDAHSGLKPICHGPQTTPAMK